MKTQLAHQFGVDLVSVVGERLFVLWTTFISILRALPLFFFVRPRTPLRVLCLLAFDTRHVFRHARRLSWPRIKVLAALLDFGACANAAFDGKRYKSKEMQATRRILHAAGVDAIVLDYLRRLRMLERKRPRVGGSLSNFQQVRLYREAVVRLSLGTVTAIAGDNTYLDSGIRATYSDAALKILFRVVMQCQIIDDIVDYRKDTVAGLPSFLTASESRTESLEHTRVTAMQYADVGDLPSSAETLPFRMALVLVSLVARLLIFARGTAANPTGVWKLSISRGDQE